MRSFRKVTLAALGLVALATAPVLADTAAYYQPPEDTAGPARSAKLMADRQFGFAPLTVNISGMLESRAGDLIPIDGSREVVLTVESPFLHMSSVAGSYHIGTDFRLESTSEGPTIPAQYVRAVELKRPGRYVFRIHVLDGSGDVIMSNEVTVKAL